MTVLLTWNRSFAAFQLIPALNDVSQYCLLLIFLSDGGGMMTEVTSSPSAGQGEISNG